jgi:hypothetical protein
MNDHLVVLDPALRVRGLQMPASARGLVLLVHVDSASQQRSGQRFIADVLRANGLATLAVTLHPAEEQRAGLPPPGQVLIKHRLRAVFDWLAIQTSTRQCPVVLLGVDDAGLCGRGGTLSARCTAFADPARWTAVPRGEAAGAPVAAHTDGRGSV